MFVNPNFTFNGIYSQDMNVSIATFDTNMFNDIGVEYTSDISIENDLVEYNPYYTESFSEPSDIELNLVIYDSTTMEAIDIDLVDMEQIMDWLCTENFAPFISDDDRDLIYYFKVIRIQKVLTFNNKGYLKVTFKPYSKYAYRRREYEIEINENASISKASSLTLNKTSVGKQSRTSKGDYVIVVVPKNEGYVVTKDNGLGGNVVFNKDVAGANGDVVLNIDGNEYAIYGEILISPAEIFIYIDKDTNANETNTSGKSIYYGRLSINEVGGSVIQYDAITPTMIKNSNNITKITPQTLDKTSIEIFNHSRTIYCPIIEITNLGDTSTINKINDMRILGLDANEKVIIDNLTKIVQTDSGINKFNCCNRKWINLKPRVKNTITLGGNCKVKIICEFPLIK